jgi:hypothetical protein
VDAAHADDLPGSAGNFLANAASLEFPDGLARAEKLSGEIHIKDKLPVVEGHLVDG